METAGIICEYNPFHTGHARQIAWLRSHLGSDSGIVCLMSGSFVQRGAPAIFDKSLRAHAAIECGADLVLELPVTYALSSAEGFATGGVHILSGFCNHLCFGTESGTVQTLQQTAAALLHPDFSPAVRRRLEEGISFPAARVLALQDLGADASLLTHPNDILAVEYCKAILAQGCSTKLLPIHRPGSYHQTAADPDSPSATAVRKLILEKNDWQPFVPEQVRGIFEDAAAHSLAAGERAILAKLRTMSDADFETLPYGSEGLWRRLMHASREYATLEQILTAVKTKRYTRSRLDRMVMCAFLGITDIVLRTPAPYTRVLAFNETGQKILKIARNSGIFLHIGEKTNEPYELLEQRCDSLYGLFCETTPERPSPKRRIWNTKEGAII